jgi:hypothetical protein
MPWRRRAPYPAIVIVLVCGFGRRPTIRGVRRDFSVGFGLFQRLSSFTVAPILPALVGMTIPATIGILSSQVDG